MKNEILKLQEVAKYFKVDEKTVYRMVQSNKLPAFKVGNQWRFLRNDIFKWIESKSTVVEIPVVKKAAAELAFLDREDIEINEVKK